MKYKVLVSAPYMQPFIERFRPRFAQHNIEIIVPTVNERLEEEDLLQYAAEIDGAICGDDRFTERVLDAAPKLKVISKWGTGIDSIDQAACYARNIAVRNTPNAFTVPVSDSVMAYLLCFARQTPWMNAAMHRGEWKKIPGRALSECTLGVVGVGNIGKMVLQKAAAFGMTLLAHDIQPIDEPLLESTGARRATLEELLQQSDFVSINCDLNPTSHHLMNDETFQLMKIGSVLINTARGPIVKEAALINALQSGKLGGAALDVFEFEPLPLDSPLLAMENVLMAPHNSNSSPTSWEHVHENTIRNLVEELEKREA